MLDGPKKGHTCVWMQTAAQAGAFRRSYAAFPLGNLLSLRTSRASASGRRPAARTDLGRRQMALQEPGWSALSLKTTSTRTLSVCACASGGPLAVFKGGSCAGEGGVKVEALSSSRTFKVFPIWGSLLMLVTSAHEQPDFRCHRRSLELACAKLISLLALGMLCLSVAQRSA